MSPVGLKYHEAQMGESGHECYNILFSGSRWLKCMYCIILCLVREKFYLSFSKNKRRRTIKILLVNVNY